MHIPTLPNNLNNDALYITDSTKLKTFKECPRKYFYEYVQHFRPDEPSIHLEFGTAWHFAKEYILLHGNGNDQVAEAYALFLEHFRKYFPPEMDLVVAPKNAGNALLALKEYCSQEYHRMGGYKVHHTEIAGMVNCSDELNLSFKLDAIVEDAQGMMWALDHKTGSRDSSIYDQSWFLSEQMFVYTHALMCMFPPEKVAGCLVDMTIFRKTGNLHKRLPIKRKQEAINAWHWECTHYGQQMQLEYQRLSDCKPNDAVLKAFPKNTESCTKWGRCPYMDLCQGAKNPLVFQEPPTGFAVRVWNPHHGDKAYKPKLFMDINGQLREPNERELIAYEQAMAAKDALLETQTALNSSNAEFSFY